MTNSYPSSSPVEYTQAQPQSSSGYNPYPTSQLSNPYRTGSQVYSPHGHLENRGIDGISSQPATMGSQHPLPIPSSDPTFIRNVAGIEAIPQPTPRAEYDAPVFKTFQERKRAKEIALMSKAGQSSQSAFSPSPLPSTFARLPTAPVPPSRTHSLPQPVSRSTPRPLPQPVRTDSAPSQIPPPARLPSPTVRSPIEANLERSDTVSSIKSLDRLGFGSPGKRPLPRPPVVVNSSKSLDRGIPGGSATSKGGTPRRQPSTVSEASEDGEGLSDAVKRMSISIRSPVIAPSTQATGSPAIVISVNSPPATYLPIPSIQLPEEPDPPVNIISISAPPVIAVSSIDDDQGLSFPVPTISEPGPSRNEGKSGPPTRLLPDSAIICSGCSLPIIGRIVSAMNQRWHPQCFTCGECGELLEHVSSYEWEGRPYCHLDYHDKFAHKCHHCKTPIVDPRFVTLEDEILGQRYYHELHFFCSECGDPFLDPSKSSAPGTETSRLPETEDDETNAFVIHRGHPYCERCHLRLHKPKCKACSKPIPDVAVTAMGAKWHKDCFVCTNCGNGFANSLFFPREGQAYCTECYERTL